MIEVVDNVGRRRIGFFVAAQERAKDVLGVQTAYRRLVRERLCGWHSEPHRNRVATRQRAQAADRWHWAYYTQQAELRLSPEASYIAKHSYEEHAPDRKIELAADLETTNLRITHEDFSQFVDASIRK